MKKAFYFTKSILNVYVPVINGYLMLDKYIYFFKIFMTLVSSLLPLGFFKEIVKKINQTQQFFHKLLFNTKKYHNKRVRKRVIKKIPRKKRYKMFASKNLTSKKCIIEIKKASRLVY